MGRYTVKFSCHHSGHCCTEVVCLPTPKDVIRIVRNTKADPYKFLEFLSPEELSGVDDDDPTWLEIDGEKFMMALRRSEKTGCHFLDKKTRYCTIYDYRPILCRLYPFRLQEDKNGNFAGFDLHPDVGCPRFKDGIFDTEKLYKLYLKDDKNQDDYHDLVAVFNKKATVETDPEDFIELFVEVHRKKKKGK